MRVEAELGVLTRWRCGRGWRSVDDERPQRLGQVVAHVVQQQEVAPGISSAVRSPPGRIRVSARPWMTSVGTGRAQAVARSPDAVMAAHLAGRALRVEARS